MNLVWHLALQEGMCMGLEIDVDQVVKPTVGLTRIEPATFRGVDCAVLAERYVAYRRNMGYDEVQCDPHAIKPAAAPSSEDV